MRLSPLSRTAVTTAGLSLILTGGIQTVAANAAVAKAPVLGCAEIVRTGHKVKIRNFCTATFSAAVTHSTTRAKNIAVNASGTFKVTRTSGLEAVFTYRGRSYRNPVV